MVSISQHRPANWTEIYRFDGSTQFFDPSKFSATFGASSITLTDKTPPLPKGFYQFKASFP